MNAKPSGFYIGTWGTWGWIETLLKGIAIAFGIAAFAASPADAPLTFGGHPHLAAVVLLLLLCSNPLFSLPLRVWQREIISIVFTVFNLLGHVGLLIALLRVPEFHSYGVGFSVFYTLGELAKYRFLRESGYTEGGLSSSAMTIGVRVVASAYALLTVLMLL